MKFAADRAFADADKAARKLLELANAVEPDRDQRIAIELINLPFLRTGGSVDEYRAGIERAIENGWLIRDLCEVHAGWRRSVRLMASGWRRRFDDPIPLPNGRQVLTLKDAAEYVQKLPKAEQLLDKWQAAVEALLLIVELNGPTMMARIGMLRALNRGYVREFDSSRKDTHWGKRKLKRDE